ncbi:putative thioredoxin [Kineococcus xinjiangensis]|uniref:Putative thioredoxin n=1 Tax=Kineococcus xinjiangensis TaxID=512762 RepID=A0A2S6IWV5_9ACTN|nr:tetratricopeptide repeat protein [Kineococcus xinjiangensis]PPK98641.1 putative thioredoxin [Kineococcus xinjiangensis]
MTQRPTPPGGGLNLRGAVDLSALAARSSRREQAVRPPAGQDAAPADAAADVLVVDVNEETFADVVQQSVTVPVVVNLHSARFAGSGELTSVLREVVVAQGGRLLLANVDMDAHPRLAQAFQTDSPLVVAVVRGQPVPLFQGPYPREQVEQVIAEVLRVAEANGVTGRIDVAAGAETAGAPAEPPLPPLHLEAQEALAAGDVDTAADAYQRALASDPRDDEAIAGLARVRLLQRTRGADLAQVRRAAADAPADVRAQALAADLDVLGGHVEDAFSRLLQLVRSTGGDEREAARAHLVDLFTVVGADDERVAKARTALSRALF